MTESLAACQPTILIAFIWLASSAGTMLAMLGEAPSEAIPGWMLLLLTHGVGARWYAVLRMERVGLRPYSCRPW